MAVGITPFTSPVSRNPAGFAWLATLARANGPEKLVNSNVT